jgi:hypothetical protein
MVRVIGVGRPRRRDRQLRSKSGQVTLLLPQETIELIDAFRVALGLKSRTEVIIRLSEDGIEVKGVVKAKLN